MASKALWTHRPPTCPVTAEFRHRAPHIWPLAQRQAPSWVLTAPGLQSSNAGSPVQRPALALPADRVASEPSLTCSGAVSSSEQRESSSWCNKMGSWRIE